MLYLIAAVELVMLTHALNQQQRMSDELSEALARVPEVVYQRKLCSCRPVCACCACEE